MAVVIRKGTRADLPGFIRLMEQVRELMANPEWFYLDTPEEIYANFDSGIMEMWVAEDNGRLAAVMDMLIPGESPLNYGCQLGFSREELARVVNMDAVAVHPDYRGQGLQCRLAQTAMDSLGNETDRILLCTIHPDNRFSLENTLSQGFEIVSRIDIYDSVRYLLRKNMKKVKNKY